MMPVKKAGETQAERKRARGWARGHKRETLPREYRLYSLLEKKYKNDEKQRTWEMMYYSVGVHPAGI